MSVRDARSRALLGRIVEIALLVIVVASPTQHAVEIAEKTYLCLVDPLVWLVCGLWFLDTLLARKLASVQIPPLHAILFVLLALLSVTRAVHRMSAFKDVFQFAEYFIAAYLLFASAMDRPAASRRVLFAFLGTGMAIIALSALHYFDAGRDAFAVKGTFGNANVLGGYLSLVLPVFLALLLHAKAWWIRGVSAFAVLLGLMVCVSGGTLIAVLIALLFVAATRGRMAFVAVATVLVVLLAFVSPRLPRDTVETARLSICLFDDENAVSTRYTEWQAAGIMVLENPLLGVGAGNYQGNVGQYYGMLPDASGEKSESDSQNLYLVLAASLGLPALACFAGLLATSATTAIRAYFRSTDALRKGALLGIAGAVLAFAVNSVWSPLLVRGIGIPLVILLSLAHVMAREVDDEHITAG